MQTIAGCLVAALGLYLVSIAGYSKRLHFWYETRSIIHHFGYVFFWGGLIMVSAGIVGWKWGIV